MGGYDDRPLAGIGGWLTFFLVTNGIVSPFAVLAGLAGLYSDPEIARSFGDAWPAIQGLEWLITALTLGLIGFLVWLLLKVRIWQSIRIVIALIWIVAIGIPLFEVVAVGMISGVSFGDLLAANTSQFVRGPIYSIIWTAYFLRSERVANTYPKEVEREVAEVFS